MLEYKDDKLGIIKVLNVTEARSHFAAMLGDRHSRYIITKNNKPLRAIIDYSEYEYLKNNFGDQFIGQPQTTGVDYPSHSEEEGTTDVEKKSKKTKNRVPGILESHIALSYSLPDKRDRTRSVEVEDFSTPDEKAPDPAEQPQTVFSQELLQQPAEETAEDYFSTAPLDDTTSEEDILPALDEHEDGERAAALESIKTLPARAPEKAATTGPATEGVAKTITETKEIIGAQPAEQRPKLEQTKQETPPPRAKPEPKKRTTEEEEYFRKYRKLYEAQAVGEENFNPETQEQHREQGLQNQKPAEESDIESELEIPIETEPSTTTPVRDGEEYFDPMRNAQAVVDARAAQAAQHKREGEGEQRQQAGQEDLPSLKDLLASLEQEKLTGEDEEVDESQIDDLIQRITED